MSGSERRHLQRMTPDKLVYIDIKPDNGGIVLNVSGDGLCFQAVAPLERWQRLAFSFSEQAPSGEDLGEVMWTDDTRKFGGLRFRDVSPEARSRIEDLLRTGSSDEDRRPQLVTPKGPPRRDDCEAVLVPEPADGPEISRIKLALVGELSTITTRRLGRNPAAKELAAPAARRRRVHANVSSAVLTLALLVSAVVASIALLHSRFPTEAQLSTTKRAEQATQVAAATASMVSSPAASTGGAALARDVRPAAEVLSRNAAKPRARMVVAAETITQHVSRGRVLITAPPVQFAYPTPTDSGVSGRVSLKLLIDTTGTVRSMAVLKGEPRLASASVRAVRGWRYRPAEQDGHPVEGEAHVTISFRGNDAVSIDFRN